MQTMNPTRVGPSITVGGGPCTSSHRRGGKERHVSRRLRKKRANGAPCSTSAWHVDLLLARFDCAGKCQLHFYGVKSKVNPVFYHINRWVPAWKFLHVSVCSSSSSGFKIWVLGLDFVPGSIVCWLVANFSVWFQVNICFWYKFQCLDAWLKDLLAFIDGFSPQLGLLFRILDRIRVLNCVFSFFWRKRMSSGLWLSDSVV